MCSVSVQPGFCRGRGVLFACTAKLTSNCTCGPQVAGVFDTLQPHKVAVRSRDYFFSVVWWKCYNSKADHACILHLHSLSYAPLQKIKQLFMASLGVVTQTEHSELAALKNLSACTEYGKLGSMQNFQMGKSSSMCSWERDVNSIPEKVNDALT